MNKAKSLRHDDRETGRTWSQRADEHVTHLLPFLVNRTLNGDEEVRVNTHLLRCPTCRSEFQEWQSIAVAAVTLPAPPAPSWVPNRVWDAAMPRHSVQPNHGNFSPDTEPAADGAVYVEGMRDASPQGDGDPSGIVAPAPRLSDLSDVLDPESTSSDVDGSSNADAVEMYAREIGRASRLSPAREVELSIAIGRGDYLVALMAQLADDFGHHPTAEVVGRAIYERFRRGWPQ
ncbi:MAG: polymerase primary sigma factor, partial [Thermomicrobiales bacterium]|nr:polymerase primary sigma factor [Thermomicrobiales bacterium]